MGTVNVFEAARVYGKVSEIVLSQVTKHMAQLNIYLIKKLKDYMEKLLMMYQIMC